MLTRETITSQTIWDDQLRQMPYNHVLQTWAWGEFKRLATGWQPLRWLYRREQESVAMVNVGMRRVGPLCVLYAPKGPALAYEDADLTAAVLDDLQRQAARMGAIWLKIDPDVVVATGVPDETDGDDIDTPDATGQRVQGQLRARQWRYSDDQVQFPNTITLDLTQSEDDLLAAMSQNTRRKVRTAAKKEVSIRAGGVDDIEMLYRLYTTTGSRDEFALRPYEYYRQAWQMMMQAGHAHALIAEYAGEPIAHVILFHFGRKCLYFIGASSNQERNRMPNYALQWQAMLWAKAQGYTTYDMWGAPTVFDESDTMWGVYQFKRGFRGTVVRYIGAWDYVPYPPLYAAYTQLIPRVRGWLRRSKSS